MGVITPLLLATAIAWTGVEPGGHLGGRPASPGYLQGKVILVDCRDYTKDPAALERMEELWNNFKTKSFVLVGSHEGAPDEEVKKALKAAGVTYPVYRGAAFAAKTFERLDGGVIYVIDDTGRMIIKTRQEHRAQECIVSAIANAAFPRTAKRYGKILDYELDVLPGKAYNHLKEMREKFPVEAKAYDDAWKRLDADTEVKRVAKLEAVVAAVRDFAGDPARRPTREKMASVIEAYEPLKASANKLLSQEVKNCIADLKWAMAALPTP